MTNHGDVPRRFVACMDVLGFRNELEKNAMSLGNAYTSAVMLARRTKAAHRIMHKKPGVSVIGKGSEIIQIPLFPHFSVQSWTSSKLVNQLSFRHSSRNLLLNDSTNAF